MLKRQPNLKRLPNLLLFDDPRFFWRPKPSHWFFPIIPAVLIAERLPLAHSCFISFYWIDVCILCSWQSSEIFSRSIAILLLFTHFFADLWSLPTSIMAFYEMTLWLTFTAIRLDMNANDPFLPLHKWDLVQWHNAYNPCILPFDISPRPPSSIPSRQLPGKTRHRFPTRQTRIEGFDGDFDGDADWWRKCGPFPVWTWRVWRRWWKQTSASADSSTDAPFARADADTIRPDRAGGVMTIDCCRAGCIMIIDCCRAGGNMEWQHVATTNNITKIIKIS